MSVLLNKLITEWSQGVQVHYTFRLLSSQAGYFFPHNLCAINPHISSSKEAPVTWYSILSKSYLGKHIHGGGCMHWIIIERGPYGLHCFVSFLFFLLFESSQCLVIRKSVSNKPFRCVRLQWGRGGLKLRQKPVIARCKIKMGGIFERPGRRNHGEILIIPPLPVFVVVEKLQAYKTMLALGIVASGKSNCYSYWITAM